MGDKFIYRRDEEGNVLIDSATGLPIKENELYTVSKEGHYYVQAPPNIPVKKELQDVYKDKFGINTLERKRAFNEMIGQQIERGFHFLYAIPDHAIAKFYKPIQNNVLLCSTKLNEDNVTVHKEEVVISKEALIELAGLIKEGGQYDGKHDDTQRKE